MYPPPTSPTYPQYAHYGSSKAYYPPTRPSYGPTLHAPIARSPSSASSISSYASSAYSGASSSTYRGLAYEPRFYTRYAGNTPPPRSHSNVANTLPPPQTGPRLHLLLDRRHYNSSSASPMLSLDLNNSRGYNPRSRYEGVSRVQLLDSLSEYATVGQQPLTLMRIVCPSIQGWEIVLRNDEGLRVDDVLRRLSSDLKPLLVGAYRNREVKFQGLEMIENRRDGISTFALYYK